MLQSSGPYFLLGDLAVVPASDVTIDPTAARTTKGRGADGPQKQRGG